MAKKFYPDESDTFLTWRWRENYSGGRLFNSRENTGKGTLTLNQRYYVCYMPKAKQKKIRQRNEKIKCDGNDYRQGR